MTRNNKQKISSQRGDIPVGQILIIGAIVIPLIIVLVMYRNDLIAFLIGAHVDVMKASAP